MLGPFTTAAKFLTALDRIDFNRGGFDGQGSCLSVKSNAKSENYCHSLTDVRLLVGSGSSVGIAQ